MPLLREITPYVGVARYYLYNGSSNERNRKGNSYAFHLFTGGGKNGYMTVDHRKIPLEKGTLVFVRPGQSHSFLISPDQPVQSHNIYCDLWQTSGYRSAVPQFTYHPHHYAIENETAQQPCPELDQLPAAVSISAFPHLLDNFIYISRTKDEQRVYGTEGLNSLFYAWLLELHHLLFAPRPSDQRIMKILQEIDAHPERNRSYEEWSEACGLRKSYFYKLFKNETGVPVHEYVVKARLKKAAAILQETDRTVTSIAQELGYTSINHFTRQFTEHFGVSPSRYRSFPEQ